MKPRDRLRLAIAMGLSVAAHRGIAGRQPPRASASIASRFVVYYGNADVAGLYDHDIAVLDSDVAPSILHKFSTDSLLLGYLSLGETHQGRAYAETLSRQSLLLAPSPQWPEARFVDVRDDRWKQIVIQQLVPAILERGFRGLFLDTLDSPAALEQGNAASFAGMTDAAAELVLAIRRAFPSIPIMVNRGYAILPRIATDVDMVLGESVHTTYDSASRSYVRVSPADIRWQLDRLYEARRLSPSLLLFSLDYWFPDDAPGIACVYAQARRHGLVPYVATIELDRVVARP